MSRSERPPKPGYQRPRHLRAVREGSADHTMTDESLEDERNGNLVSEIEQRKPKKLSPMHFAFANAINDQFVATAAHELKSDSHGRGRDSLTELGGMLRIISLYDTLTRIESVNHHLYTAHALESGPMDLKRCRFVLTDSKDLKRMAKLLYERSVGLMPVIVDTVAEPTSLEQPAMQLILISSMQQLSPGTWQISYVDMQKMKDAKNYETSSVMIDTHSGETSGNVLHHQEAYLFLPDPGPNSPKHITPENFTKAA